MTSSVCMIVMRLAGRPARRSSSTCAMTSPWRRDGWRLLLAGALFAAFKWQATQLYARAVVELVLWQMGA